MVRDDQFTRGTVNEALSAVPIMGRVTLRAAGFKPIDDPKPSDLTDPKNYNGGICYKRVSRLQAGDFLFRFSDSRCTTVESKFAGDWWFDNECFATIRWAARLRTADFTESARSHLGVLYEWGDMKNLVGGVLTADFWCYKGLTGAFDGARQHMSGPMRTDVVQIYVPGGLKLAYFRQTHDNILASGIV